VRGNWKLRPGHVKAWLPHRLPLIPSPIVGIVNTQDIFLARCTGKAPSNATSHNRLWCRNRLILALPIRTQQRSKSQMSSFTSESLRVHSPWLAAVAVIPAEAGIQRNGLDSVSGTE
jgi:hypothetical protein